jgi:hypothetical protein
MSILNYPGFQTLPRGARQLLLVSETHFFEQPASHRQNLNGIAQAVRASRCLKVLLTTLFITAGIALGLLA